MAKDKSKKADKATANDDFAKPSEAPAGGDGWSLTDGDESKSGKNDGRLFLITPLREKEVEVTRGKKTETVTVVVADIVEINEKKPEKSELHEEVFVWAKWVQGSIRGFIGERRVLGRLNKEDDSASAVGYVWKLNDATEKDIAAAREYLASLDPFATKKGAKKDDDGDEPKAKKKKAKK